MRLLQIGRDVWAHLIIQLYHPQTTNLQMAIIQQGSQAGIIGMAEEAHIEIPLQSTKLTIVTVVSVPAPQPPTNTTLTIV